MSLYKFTMKSFRFWFTSNLLQANSTALKLLAVVFFFLLLVLCVSFKSLENNNEYENPRLNTVIYHARKNEFHNKQDLIQFATELIEHSKDSVEQKIGEYYKAKAKFYGLPNKENSQKIIDFRDFFKTNRIYQFVYEIDRIKIINHYLDYDIIGAAEYMNSMDSYILGEEFFPERTALVHATNQNPSLLYTPEHKETLEKAIAMISDKNTSVYAALIIALSNYYNHIGEINYANDILEDYIEELKKYGNNLLQAYALQILANRRPLVDQSIQDISTARDLIRQADYKILLNTLWRDLGKYYEKKGEYKLAYEAYVNAIAYDEEIGDEISSSINHTNAARALYFYKPNELDDEVKQQFDLAKVHSKNHPYPLSYLYKNQIDVYKSAKQPQQLIEDKNAELLDLQDDHNKFLELNARDFVTKKMLEYQSKDHVISNLEEDNAMQQKRLQMQSFVFFLCFLLAIGIAYIGYLLIQKSSFTKQLREKSKQLSKVNNELEEKNEYISSQYSTLSEQEKQLRAELQSKISLLQSQSNSLVELEESIQKDRNLDQERKRQYLKQLQNMNTNAELLDEMKIQLSELHKSFVQKLTQEHPSLTNNNIMLCIYLRMNLSTKEIAMLNNSSTNTIKMARSRLRKKLGLTGGNQHLVTYINGL